MGSFFIIGDSQESYFAPTLRYVYMVLKLTYKFQPDSHMESRLFKKFMKSVRKWITLRIIF